MRKEKLGQNRPKIHEFVQVDFKKTDELLSKIKLSLIE